VELLRGCGSRMRKLNLFIKRCIDFFGSLFGIILILPLLIIIALAIKFTSKGPAFFRQERLGKKGKVFKILKFRTMVVNAEKIGDGLKVKSENDNRITKVGKFLRATSLDELPQLLNVLVGDMSMVGPRPPVTYFPYDGYDSYPDWAKKRFEMRPGVTGLTQVTVRNAVPWDERILIDNQYIDKFNVWEDIKILFNTFQKLFKSQDIYMSIETENMKVEKSKKGKVES
jgi:lipopolysaccharide/colanic/teichoic acid biosynthesis glycosyltransferase